jgi:spore coat polysaccharide biosynthesis protein SpsF
MTTVRYVLQARMASSRLPGKALLKVGGHPAVVLAALRAGRNGKPIVVATSTEASDDVLAETVTTAGMRLVRGPLEDVLKRFVMATDDMKDNDIAVRLTADNVVPDAAFVGRVVSRLEESDFDYVGTASPQNGLPYGLSAEAFRVGMLREADRNAVTAHDRGDVTPWIVRHGRSAIYSEPTPDGLGANIRCTIDTQDDYEAVAGAVAKVRDPVACDSLEILKRLAEAPGSARFRVPFWLDGELAIGRCVLGTVQFGLDYGWANARARPSRADASAMVRSAIAHGVTDIDTARCYGDAEEVIGEALRGGWRSRVRLLTKVDPPAEGESTADALRHADDQVLASLRALRSDTLDVVMLREAWPLRRANAFWDRMLELRAKGTIGTLGLSAQTPKEALLALADPQIGHIQLPYNILDYRWHEAGVPQAARQRKNCVVHARSIYLQGLLVDRAPADWPLVAGVNATEIVAQLDAAARDAGFTDRAALCLAYARSRDWIDGIVIGVDNAAQLQENLSRFNDVPLDTERADGLAASLPRVPDGLLNPSTWSH